MVLFIDSDKTITLRLQQLNVMFGILYNAVNALEWDADIQKYTDGINPSFDLTKDEYGSLIGALTELIR